MQHLGPRVPIVIQPQSDGKAQKGTALIDTGAAGTCVDRQAAERAGMAVVGSGKMASATHENETVPIYAGTIQIAQDVNVVCRRAYGANLKSQGLIALIGRDLMANGVLIVNGPEGTVTLALP